MVLTNGKQINGEKITKEEGKTAKLGKITITLFIIALLIGAGWLILSHYEGWKISSNVPPARIVTDEELKAADEGEKIFNKIVAKYPSINLEPTISALATPNPYLLLILPKKEWARLSKKDQMNLTYYLENRKIVAARISPHRYITIPPNAPVYKSFYEKASKLCDDCWAIGIGQISPDGKKVYWKNTIVQGDSIHEKMGSGISSSEFRKDFKQMTLVEKTKPNKIRKNIKETKQASEKTEKSKNGKNSSKRLQEEGPLKGEQAEEEDMGSSSFKTKLLNDYYNTMWGRIQPEWTYLQDLYERKTGLEAIVAVVIERGGMVQRTWLQKKSGDDLYDQMALRAIEKAEPFPPIPKELGNNTLEVNIHFHPD